MPARGEHGDPEDLLGEAWAALDEGRPREALELAEGAEPMDGERGALETLAYLDLGDLRSAEHALARARADLPPRHPDRLLAEGELALATWRVRDARRAFEALAREVPSAWGLERLALCHDLEGDTRAADRALARAHRLDPEARPRPVRLSEDEFDRVVREAIEGLPPQFQRALERVAYVVDPVPDEDLASGSLDTPPDLLGLFVGRSLVERGHDDSGELPPTIFLFRRNLERAARDRDDLVHEIRVTLYHEIGHALGYDEDGVAGLGLA